MSESMKVVVAGFFDECIVVRPEPDSDQTFGVAVGTPFTIYPGHEPRYTEAEWREKAAPQDARTSLPPEVLEALEEAGRLHAGARPKDYATTEALYQSATEQIRDEWTRPTVLIRPRVYPDGDQWCALYGANIQEGVAGFGPTPEAACRDFDAHWLRGRHGRDHSEDLQGSARQNGDV